jgi:hypothetical protein
MGNNYKTKKTGRIILGAVLFVFIVFSLSRSFKQFYVFNLDGDIAESVLPYPDIQKTFDDPTGIKTIINNDKHLGPNRFFSHYFMYKTFREIPLFLQNFCDPVNSVYYTSAIAKSLMLIMLLFLLAVIITGSVKLFSLKFILAVAILIPFFQVNGRHLYTDIGIIDRSITYSFFYAMPLIFVLIYYLPLSLELLHNRIIKINWILIILWTIIAIMACFSGPIFPPVILIINLLLFSHLYIKNWKVTENQTFFKKTFKTFKSMGIRAHLFLIPISFLALYSTFLGTFNNAFADIQLSLKELYLLLPKGIFRSFFSTSYVIIILLLIANYLILFYKYKNDTQYKKIIGLYRLLIIFSVIYVILLPLGGYRDCRPFILRYDTIIPITVLSLITICLGFLFILKKMLTEKGASYLKITYSIVFLAVFAFFTIKNKVYVYNECEKSSLYTIAQSQDDIVALDYNDCSVLSWGPIYDPEITEFFGYGKLIYLWKITDRPKKYYCLPSSNDQQ